MQKEASALSKSQVLTTKLKPPLKSSSTTKPIIGMAQRRRSETTSKAPVPKVVTQKRQQYQSNESVNPLRSATSML